MERREYRRIRKSRFSAAGKLDLHGKTRQEAFRALRSFVIEASANGLREVLVVTGRGRRVWEWEKSDGVLHTSLREWLRHKEIAPYVLSPARQAGPEHGGDGAWYVRLRQRPRH